MSVLARDNHPWPVLPNPVALTFHLRKTALVRWVKNSVKSRLTSSSTVLRRWPPRAPLFETNKINCPTNCVEWKITRLMKILQKYQNSVEILILRWTRSKILEEFQKLRPKWLTFKGERCKWRRAGEWRRLYSAPIVVLGYSRYTGSYAATSCRPLYLLGQGEAFVTPPW